MISSTNSTPNEESIRRYYGVIDEPFGHKSQLNRDMGEGYGSPGYAKEELRAELGAMILKADFGISLQGEHFQDHSNYLNSWIAALQGDFNELFRAAADAERAANMVMGNYRAKELLAQQE